MRARRNAGVTVTFELVVDGLSSTWLRGHAMALTFSVMSVRDMSPVRGGSSRVSSVTCLEVWASQLPVEQSGLRAHKVEN